MKTVGIVGGWGHVGLPLGIAFARAGRSVVLIDVDEARVRDVSAGKMPFLERGADEALRAALGTGKLQATSALSAAGESDAVIVTIGTPVDEFLDPDIRSFDRGIDA